MTKKVSVVLTLEVDATKDESEIRQNLVDIFEFPDIGVDLVYISPLMEEEGIHKNE